MTKSEAKERILSLFTEVYNDNGWFVDRLDIDVIKECVEAGVNLNTSYNAWDLGKAPLFLLLLNGYEIFRKSSKEEVKKLYDYLVANGGDITKNTTKTMSSLGYSLKNGALKTAEYLFDDGIKGESDSKNLLLLAIEHDWLKGDDREGLVRKLASVGFDLSVMTKGNYHNLLTLAAHNSLASAVKGLLDAGVNPDIANKYNATALMYACGEPVNGSSHLIQQKGLELVELLLSYGASVDVKTTQKRTALSIAKKYNHHTEDDKEKIISLIDSASKS